jgi:hypothetical protein
MDLGGKERTPAQEGRDTPRKTSRSLMMFFILGLAVTVQPASVSAAPSILLQPIYVSMD